MACLNKPARRGGIVSVEVALLFPLLLLLTFGLIEYGWLFLKSHQITNAARQGARVGARTDGTNADAQDTVASLMGAAGMGASGYSLTISPGPVETLSTGDPLTVEVSVPYANVRLLGLPLIPVPANLTASTTMAKEGP